MLVNGTPQQHGFAFPGEFAAQQQVWLAWPSRPDNWREHALPAQQAYAALAEAIAKVVKVKVAVLPELMDSAREQLGPEIELVAMAYNDAWMRDIGPTVLRNKAGQLRAVSWRFNAWGGELDGLYQNWSADQQVASKVAELSGLDYYQAPFVLEGGAIHSDGEGTLYTTEECLLHPSRNPQLNKQELEQALGDYLSINKVIWLPQGLYNDETNGHVDNILHVVAPAKVLLHWCEEPADPQYAISRRALDALQTQQDAKGRSIEVFKLPHPGPLYLSEAEAKGIKPSLGMARAGGERLAASYANCLLCNGHVFVPELDSATDDLAKHVIQQALPDYQVVGIPTREILLGGGNIHCVTQQIPCGSR